MTAFKPSSRAPSLFHRKKRRVLPVVLVVLLLAAAVGGGVWWLQRDEGPRDVERTKVVRACDIPVDVLEKVWNGFSRGRSGDVLAIERFPNQFTTRHSTPFPYTQDVPLLFYGPGWIEPMESGEPVTVADLAPTLAELLDFNGGDGFQARDGRILSEALATGREGMPKLILNIVWDGGGDNVLEQWPDSWPNLARLMERSANFTNATVGSSPSITPSIHANMGTGAFPRHHGLVDTKIRVNGGKDIVDAWEGISPRYLREETLADRWDLANGNAPLVGMLARDAWHLGMIGHGSYLEGADQDIAVMDDFGAVEFRDPKAYYRLPDYVLGNEGLQEAIDEVDLRDGEADQRWLGNPLIAVDGRVRETPAWSIYQTGVLEELLRTEGFGSDDVTDLFYVNYKSTDLIGHSFNMTEPEERDALEEQDRQLEEIIRMLDDIVGRGEWVMTLTADHGMTPYPSVSGGWSIVMSEMGADIEREFGTGIFVTNRGYQLFLDKKAARRRGVSAQDVARFIRNYTIEQNARGDIPEAFADRAEEKVFLTAVTPKELKAALDCARES